MRGAKRSVGTGKERHGGSPPLSKGQRSGRWSAASRWWTTSMLGVPPILRTALDGISPSITRRSSGRQITCRFRSVDPSRRVAKTSHRKGAVGSVQDPRSGTRAAPQGGRPQLSEQRTNALHCGGRDGVRPAIRSPHRRHWWLPL